MSQISHKITTKQLLDISAEISAMYQAEEITSEEKNTLVDLFQNTSDLEEIFKQLGGFANPDAGCALAELLRR